MANDGFDRPVALPLGIDRMADWFKSRERGIVLIAVLMHLIILVSMIGLRMIPLLTGQTIVLKVVPVDPRDFFRGDYVILSYEISNRSTIDDALDARETKRYSDWQDQPVYVLLEPDASGTEWKAAGYRLEPPSTGTFIRGRVASYNRLEFGIESFYVEEGGGTKYENAARNGTLMAEIALTSSGKAALKSLIIRD